MLIIVQARCGSSRFPEKVCQQILYQGENITLLEFLLNRLLKSKRHHVILATTCQKTDDSIENIYQTISNPNLSLYRGSNSDVLDRFYQASKITLPQRRDPIVRITADCPLLSIEILEEAEALFRESQVDYLRFGSDDGFPDGLDLEIMTYQILEEAHQKATLPYQREHVTPWIRFTSTCPKIYSPEYFKKSKLVQEILRSNKFTILDDLFLSLDVFDDLKLIQTLISSSKNFELSLEELLKNCQDLENHDPGFFKRRKELHQQTSKPTKNGLGQKLYLEKGKELILGGTNLLSKRPQLHLPNYWPSYYQKADGIQISTLDGVKLLDFGYMSVGTSILGYQDPDVDTAVIKAVEKGSISTLNCPSEVRLAEKMIELHPWANPGMAKMTRGSGEACAMSIRIGRAAAHKSSGHPRDLVAFCGYHGWHDWYLAANLESDKLGDHLLAGLEPLGVPQALKGSIKPFHFNQYAELEQIWNDSQGGLGVVIMEVYRSTPPDLEFLQKIRDLCTQHQITLIFDEVTSGFRINTGGVHLNYGISPDLAIFGKALGNGYPISMVLGKKPIMMLAEASFISSTYWTEDLGPSAALAMIEKHQKLNLGKLLKERGLGFQKRILEWSKSIGLNLQISGMPSLFHFSFKGSECQFSDYVNRGIKTYYTQLMLEEGLLASTSLYLSYAHTPELLQIYYEKIQKVFPKIKKLIDDLEGPNLKYQKELLEELLWGPVSTPKFGRLN